MSDKFFERLGREAAVGERQMMAATAPTPQPAGWVNETGAQGGGQPNFSGFKRWEGAMRKRISNGLEEFAAALIAGSFSVLLLWYIDVTPTWQLAAWLGGLGGGCALLRVVTVRG